MKQILPPGTYCTLLLSLVAALCILPCYAQPTDQAAFQQALESVESTTPIPASMAPHIGNFYSAQLGLTYPPCPCLPMNLPFWSLGNGFYIYDDLDVDYSSLYPSSPSSPSSFAPMASFASRFRPSPPPCGSGGQPYLTNVICTPTTNLGMTVQFDISGGVSNQVYDILTTTNLTALNASNSTWKWIGQGVTCDTYIFYNQPKAFSYYMLAPARPSVVIAWGDDSFAQSEPPLGLSNAVAVTAGFDFAGTLSSNALINLGVFPDSIFATQNPQTNQISRGTNVNGYYSYGIHSLSLPIGFATNGFLQFSGQSSWHVMTCHESFSGHLFDAEHSSYGHWFSKNAFGGTNYENTPAGAIGNCNECGCAPGTDVLIYWANGRMWSVAAWLSFGLQSGPIAIGDPFIVQ